MTDHEIKRKQAVTAFVEAEEERALRPGSEYPGKPLHRHAYVAEQIKLQAARIAELEAAVDRLPKTADRVPVLLGDVVYSPSGRRHRVLCERFGQGKSWYVPEAFPDENGDWHDALVCECYSTKAAARAAAEGTQ